MTSSGFPPDHFTFPAVLKAAGAIQDLEIGRQLHAAAVKFGYHTRPVTVANTLITFYAKCSDIDSVRKVFDRIHDRDQVSWNSMIGALCMFEEWDLALNLFRYMMEESAEAPSSFTLVSVVSACSNLRRRDGLRMGKQVHCYGLRTGLYSGEKTFTKNSLISMYAKLGRVKDSSMLFEQFDCRDIVTWNTMISSLTQNGQFEEAVLVFRQMLGCSLRPDGITMSSVLPACSGLENFDWGREIHAHVMRNDGLRQNSFVGSALVDMYCSCGRVEHGRRVFDRIPERRLGLWNAMISGYAQNELDEEALSLFIDMEMDAGLTPNATTISSVLPACVRSASFPRKEDIHGYVVKRGFEGDRYVQNALLDMYARAGMLAISEKIFKSMEDRDVVSWNTMIMGYVINESYGDAFNLLCEMQGVRVAAMAEDQDGSSYGADKPNCVTLITVLPACALLAALGKGKEIHAYAIRNLLASDVAVGSALVDMYAKCGSLRHSRRAFNQMTKRNAITWNVLIMAYGMNGLGVEALRLLQEMVTRGNQGDNVKPNEVTFISVFAACSHSGMVAEGLEIFHRMKSDYGIQPTPEHYACVVDLLGRAGKLAQAYDLICSMETGRARAGAWSSLLGACRVHRNVELGEIAASHLLQLEPHVASHYVLLSNIYASAGLWAQAMEVRRNMKEIGVRKEPGCSWIEVGDEVHQFMVGDLLHPKNEQVQQYLESLWERMRKEGYLPDTSCVLHDVDDSQKEMLLCGHSEKVAIAFGILNSAPGSVIRVAKNLRVCNDCHAAAKFISKIVEREIVLRDVRRFHHFKNGSCSCGDYW
ncbi:unnamed protein product [Spirodela intermedia]|uniref:DYW domain-containing protein n=1 Tax=Spirodela intermedia TaxID=51605 RepID=A0A7I8LG83_SPIIN|nr:unnamed protein product [Spirodela intermedia]